MSTAYPQVPAPVPVTNPYIARRHALGLPAGSVRAAHVLGITALVCALLLIPAKQTVGVPPYLLYLVFLMIGHYFAAHGVTIATRDDRAASPLYLPGGVVRVLVFVALAATLGWKFYADPDGLRGQFDKSVELLQAEPLTPLLVLGGFFLGAVVRSLIGRNPAAAWQDFEAWVSLLALVGLGAAAVIHLVIAPSLEEQLWMPNWEGALGAVVAFYFGERS